MSEKDSLHQDTHLKVLRLLQANPQMNQREMAAALGVSLGKTNFCLKALLDKGLLKMQNFQNSKRKLAYAYAPAQRIGQGLEVAMPWYIGQPH